eukprot:TRINITY_DN602_c0_g3_i1.p1 TRINITY_DN602_c0_g3~~TRINITY_DN602_c0_g3_i1.p1  ORF type:complete len:1852 (+),score=550.67 TRINITY_DN602_c0_g3_i1:112-5556(+)
MQQANGGTPPAPPPAAAATAEHTAAGAAPGGGDGAARPPFQSPVHLPQIHPGLPLPIPPAARRLFAAADGLTEQQQQQPEQQQPEQHPPPPWYFQGGGRGDEGGEEEGLSDSPPPWAEPGGVWGAAQSALEPSPRWGASAHHFLPEPPGPARRAGFAPVAEGGGFAAAPEPGGGREQLSHPCRSCSFLNAPGAAECASCLARLGGEPWRCPGCQAICAGELADCSACGAPRPPSTLAGREALDDGGSVEQRVAVQCDWPLFPEAVRWIEDASGGRVELSAVRRSDGGGEVPTVAAPADLPDCEVWPPIPGDDAVPDSQVREVREGDAVRTLPYDARMRTQRCGWGAHMAAFCGKEAVVKRLIVSEERAQVLLRFRDVVVDPLAGIPEDRRDQAWFDYEWVEVPEGSRLPSPPGGWYEKLRRFPLQVGDICRVRPYDPRMRRMRSGWDDRMHRLAGRAGVILRVVVTARLAQASLAFNLPQGEATAWWDLEWLDVPPAARVAAAGPPVTTGICSGHVTVVASAVRQCPQGHACLRWVRDPYEARAGGAVECEGCGRGGIRGEEVLHCAYCDYDLCAACATGARVVERAEAVIAALSTWARAGGLREDWLPLIGEQLQHCADSPGARVALRPCRLSDGRAATLCVTLGATAPVATAVGGRIICRIPQAGGGAGPAALSRVDADVLLGIERAFRCRVATLPTAQHQPAATVAVLGPRENRSKAAGKLVWYSASRRVVVRVPPSETGVIQRKVREIRERAKCHVSVDGGAVVKLIGLAHAAAAARIAIRQLLAQHRAALQQQRVDRALRAAVAELCEVRVTVPIAAPLRAVLSQLHEPAPDNRAAAAAAAHAARARRRLLQESEEDVRAIRAQAEEALVELHRAARGELSALGIDADLAMPANVAGVRPFRVGDRVVRGPDWDWGDQDGGEGAEPGRVVDLPVREEVVGGHQGGLIEGYLTVEWAAGQRYNYRVGREREVIHAAEEGEELGEGNEGDSVAQRLLRHKQALLHLVNAAAALAAQQRLLLAAAGDDDPPRAGGWLSGWREQLQQWLHAATRNKARAERAVAAAVAALAREEARAACTVAITESLPPPTPGGSCAAGIVDAEQARGAATRHAAAVRALKERVQHDGDHAVSQLARRSAKLRRALAEELQRRKFTGWDIILSIMQETGALCEYRSGDSHLVLSGAEAAVRRARELLRGLTVRDLYAWARCEATLALPPAAFEQAGRLHCTLLRIAEQISGAESVAPLEPCCVAIRGTRPQIRHAAELLRQRLDLPAPVQLRWVDDLPLLSPPPPTGPSTAADELAELEGLPPRALKALARRLGLPRDLEEDFDGSPDYVAWITSCRGAASGSAPETPSRRRGGMDAAPLVEEAPATIGAECCVCFGELTSASAATLICGHAACVDCLRQWADECMQRREAVECPSRGCRHVLTSAEYREVVGRTGGDAGGASMTEYELRMARHKLQGAVRECHACASGFAVMADDGSSVPISCGSCGTMLCPFGCGEGAHCFLLCSEAKVARRATLLRRRGRARELSVRQGLDAELKRLGEVALSEASLQGEMTAEGETRPCPRCGALVCRIGGCASMQCSCGHRFCHRCLQPDCELVEAPGPKLRCDPGGLAERVRSAVAVHEGRTVYEGWALCDVCDRYPLPSSVPLYSCAQCTDWHVCGDCETAGLADTQHDPSHVLFELNRIGEPTGPRPDPPPMGPDYKLDWGEILSAAEHAAADAAELHMGSPRSPELGPAWPPTPLSTPGNPEPEQQTDGSPVQMDAPPLALDPSLDGDAGYPAAPLAAAVIPVSDLSDAELTPH